MNNRYIVLDVAIFKTIILILFFPLCPFSKDKPNVVLYPVIEGLSNAKEVTLIAEGQEVWVENLKQPIPQDAPWWFFTVPSASNMEVNVASFACSGVTNLCVKVTNPISKVVVRPKSKNIKFEKKGNVLNFKIPGPCKLFVEIDSMPPLLVFANPLETNKPTERDKNIRIFGPGVHTPGIMTLNDNEQIYIAPGAIVYGGFRGNPKHVKIFGRGILDGSLMKDRTIVLEGASDVAFEGITIRCGASWQNTLNNCENITYNDVKVISFGPTGDGIDPVCSSKIKIHDCFFRCSDDCIAVKGAHNGPSVSDITVTNCTMAGYTSDGFTIGFETVTKSISNILVKNCDILYALGSNKVGEHSAFSIICDGPATVENIRFEDIRVEENVARLFELNVTDAQHYTKTSPGHIKGIYLKNIKWSINAPIILKGFDENHLVEDVTFEACTIAGKPLEGEEDEHFEIEKFVKNVRVIK